MRGASVRYAMVGLLVWWCTPMAGAEELRLQAIADAHPLPAVRDFAGPELIGAALRLSIPRWPGGSAERKPTELYPLHWAALTNQPAAALSLIEHGMAADTRDGEGRTPLMVAAAFDSPEVADVLLAHGADPRARDRLNGNAPLDFAALSGHAGMAEMLLSLDVDVNGRASHNGETPLHYASLYGHTKVIALLAANGAELDSADNSGVRPLQYATKRKRTLAVDMLLGLGARPDDLHDAVNAGDVARVQALIGAGADVNALDMIGTPLHLAAATGQLMIAVMLLEAGADLEAKGDPAGAHPLHVAAINNRAEAARLLIDRGASLDVEDNFGKTPLAVAASFGNVEVAETLLRRGADPLGQKIHHGAPIHFATKSGNLQMVELLLSYDVDVNSRGWDNAPLLTHAAHAGDLGMIEFLVAHGADPNMRDDAGRTPLQAALARGKQVPEAIDYLRRISSPE